MSQLTEWKIKRTDTCFSNVLVDFNVNENVQKLGFAVSEENLTAANAALSSLLLNPISNKHDSNEMCTAEARLFLEAYC